MYLDTAAEAVVPGSNPASLTVAKTLRTGRVTVFTVKSRGREGNLPLRPKKREKKVAKPKKYRISLEANTGTGN